MINSLRRWLDRTVTYLTSDFWPRLKLHFQDNPESLEFAQRIAIAFGAWLIAQAIPGAPVVGSFIHEVVPGWLARSVEMTQAVIH